MNSKACGECAGSPRRLARQSHYFNYRVFLPSVLLAGQDGSSHSSRGFTSCLLAQIKHIGLKPTKE